MRGCLADVSEWASLHILLCCWCRKRKIKGMCSTRQQRNNKKQCEITSSDWCSQSFLRLSCSWPAGVFVTVSPDDDVPSKSTFWSNPSWRTFFKVFNESLRKFMIFHIARALTTLLKDLFQLSRSLVNRLFPFYREKFNFLNFLDVNNWTMQEKLNRNSKNNNPLNYIEVSLKFIR